MTQAAILEITPEVAVAASAAAPTLTVVIPALNEQSAIGGTITACLEAVDDIKEVGGVADVQIIVVSDGSTDRTAAIARSFENVTVIEFETNRGYGAAIKAGFGASHGELVGFLDGDGTCDPRYFGPMCRTVLTENAAVVLGSRLGPGSKMPVVRRLGNRLYAILLGFLCGRWVTDTASGMRVLRRSALDHLYPLPDGLHFTPSMSARALLNGLRVSEIPMAYKERIGTSKLSVVADGVRFLRTIIDGVLCYQPERLFLIGFAVCLMAGVALAAYPVEFYLRHGRVEEWMIYRFLACGLLGSVGYQLLGSAAIANRMATFGPRRRTGDSFWAAILSSLFEGWFLTAFVVTLVGAAGVLLWPGIVEYVSAGTVSLHWSRVVVVAFGLLLVSQALVTSVLLRVLNIWKTPVA